MILDGVFEMLSRRQYIAWSAKPKNGGVPPDQAGIQWDAEFQTSKLPKDRLGRAADDLDRVAIKVKDLVIFRDQQSRSQGYSLKQGEKRKATEADIAKADTQMADAPM